MKYAVYFCGEFSGEIISEKEAKRRKMIDRETENDTHDYEPIFDGIVYPDVPTSVSAQIEKYGFQYNDDRRPISFPELMEMAKDKYNEGGDGIVECWDENTYKAYVKEFGPMKKADADMLISLRN